MQLYNDEKSVTSSASVTLRNIKVYDYTMGYEDNNINQLQRLAKECLEARLKANEAREAQLQIENQLLELASVQQSLKNNGTSSFLDGFFKITTKLNKKWNQKQLENILVSNDLPIMPFDIEYKPNNSKLKILEEEYPDIYQQIAAALTVSPAKPYFAFKED